MNFSISLYYNMFVSRYQIIVIIEIIRIPVLKILAWQEFGRKNLK